MQFQIKRGYKRNLLDENNNPLIPLEEGSWYLTLDTTEVFVALNGELKPLNQANINLDDYDERFNAIEDRLTALEAKTPEQEVYTFPKYSDFPKEGKENIIYIALDKNASYVYAYGGYVCIANMDVQVIHGGNAQFKL